MNIDRVWLYVVTQTTTHLQYISHGYGDIHCVYMVTPPIR